MTHEQELRRIAHDAAEAAAKQVQRETFAFMGVDVSDQTSINRFRADLVYAHRLRRLSERLGVGVALAVLTSFVLGALALFWDGFREALR